MIPLVRVLPEDHGDEHGVASTVRTSCGRYGAEVAVERIQPASGGQGDLRRAAGGQPAGPEPADRIRRAPPQLRRSTAAPPRAAVDIRQPEHDAAAAAIDQRAAQRADRSAPPGPLRRSRRTISCVTSQANATIARRLQDGEQPADGERAARRRRVARGDADRRGARSGRPGRAAGASSGMCARRDALAEDPVRPALVEQDERQEDQRRPRS